MDQEIYKINFYTAVVKGVVNYQDYIAPYIASALYHNKDGISEILVDDADLFTKEHNSSLKVLDKYFSGRYLIRQIPEYAQKILPNTVRFLTAPTKQVEFTYIGDVDILILDPHVSSWHRDYMNKQNMCYSNNRRKDQPILTGLQCVKTQEYYSKIDEQYMRLFVDSLERNNLNYTHHDEKVLYSIVKHRIGKIPDDYYSFATRPVHGIHMSPNREPLGQPGWEINPQNAVNYILFRETEMWQELKPTLSSIYKAQLEKIDQVVEPIIQYSNRKI